MKFPAVQAGTNLRALILLLCVIAAMRVLIFSAAFPFFSVVDEQMHFDLVTHYAHGEPPRTLPPITAEALPYIVWFSTAEYLWTPASQPHGMFTPPPWQFSETDATNWLAPREKFWRESVINHEASQPPLYYCLAGAWWRAGEWLPLSRGDRLLWLRLLNVGLLVTLVWLGFVAARQVFPESQFIQIAIPALIAFLPQSIFYAINNDIVSPLAFGAAFLLLLKFCETEKPPIGLAIFSGLALAAVGLTKNTNLPFLAIAEVFLALKVWQLISVGKLRASISPLAWLAVSAGLPLLAWLLWCKIFFGDFTGSAQKARALGWTIQPFAEWLHHPIFTVSGFWFFLKNNLASFWFGEQLWHDQPLENIWANLLVVILSLAMPGWVLLVLLRRRTTFTAQQQTAAWLGFAGILAAFAFYAFLSIRFDFHDCFKPSRAQPFFTAGRMSLGLLIPFMLLFAGGVDQLTKRFSQRTKYILLGAFLVFLFASEITTDWPVFASEYNWFHM